MKYQKSLFLFRRDLRLEDNTGLIAACAQSEIVIPCFIFDKDQVGPSNKLRSFNAIQCMVESLEDLEQTLKKRHGRLYAFHGSYHTIVEKIIRATKAQALFTNRDYTPFSIARDKKLQKICHKHKVAWEQQNDLLLNEPEAILSGSGKPYSIFTAFYKRSLQEPIRKPKNLGSAHFFNKPIEGTIRNIRTFIKKENKEIATRGGRKTALALLHALPHLKDYARTHDIPSKETSHLSAHLKFGTISIREAYYAIRHDLGIHHPLLRQLYWRDFFTHVVYHAPRVFGHPYHAKYEKLPWRYAKKDFQAWCKGKTGFPIVDAGMRQLNETGWMHNRVRMIVASFLVKDLHLNWQWGERYFAQKLVDYDPSLNNGNWQWSASTGCDAQPYFRIFNPWLQQKKFDPQCVYIKKWIPELRSIDTKIIHAWYKQSKSTVDYPKPMVHHDEQVKLAKMMYKKVATLGA